MFFNDTATTEIYTLSLHDALPFFFNDSPTTKIYPLSLHDALPICCQPSRCRRPRQPGDLKSDELACREHPTQFRSEEHTSNSSHSQISYAVFCLKKKKRFSRNAETDLVCSLLLDTQTCRNYDTHTS